MSMREWCTYSSAYINTMALLEPLRLIMPTIHRLCTFIGSNALANKEKGSPPPLLHCLLCKRLFCLLTSSANNTKRPRNEQKEHWTNYICEASQVGSYVKEFKQCERNHSRNRPNAVKQDISSNLLL